MARGASPSRTSQRCPIHLWDYRGKYYRWIEDVAARCRHGNIPLGLPAFQLLGQEALLAAKVPQKASEQTHSLAFNFRLRGIVVGWVRANKREAKKKKVQSLDTDRTNRKINWNQKKKNPRRNSKGRSSLLSLWNYAGYSVIIGGCLGRYILVFVQQWYVDRLGKSSVMQLLISLQAKQQYL